MKSFGKVKYRRYAFTLAEVLITITVIGIVAALTIPNLVNNYQTKQQNTAASAFETKLGEALRIMNTQQNLVGLGTTENFVNNLQKYIKITKICDNTQLNECFTEEINGATSVVNLSDESTYSNDPNSPTKAESLKTAKELGKKDWGTNTMGLQFANGVSGIIAYNPECNANPFDNNAIVISGDKNNIKFSTDCIALVYDTTSFSKPNQKNKDIRLSNATVGDEGCAFKIGDACIKAIAKPPAITSAECENLKSELGINDCKSDTDYWAGAVKYCGGKQNMLTSAELDTLASYVFQNEERAYALGLTKTGKTSWTYLWGDTEYNNATSGVGNYSTMRRALVIGYFGNPSDDGNWGDRSRSTSNKSVFCKQ